MFIPNAETNADSGDLNCGPDRILVNARIDSIPILDDDDKQIGWMYVTVCNVPTTMDVYCCVPLTIE